MPLPGMIPRCFLQFLLFRNGHDNTLSVSVQLVELEELLHLVVVGLGVRVNHLLRGLTCLHIVAEIV